MKQIPAIKARFKHAHTMLIVIFPRLNHNKNPEIRTPIIQQLNANGPSIFKSLNGRSTSKKSKAPTIKQRIEIEDKK